VTLRGKNNHYNVKFLKGYGISISLKKNKLILKNGYDFFSKQQEKEEWFVKNMPYEKIVLSGKGYISTEALGLLCENNRNLVIVNTYGKPVSMINSVRESLTATKYRMAQYDTFRDPQKREYLARQIVKAKVETQIQFLESTNNPEVQEGIKILKDSLGLKFPF